MIPASASIVGAAVPDESAALHVAGRSEFVDDIPDTDETIHLALVLSPVAHGRVRGWDDAAVRGVPGVLGVLTAADIPAANSCGPILADEPILAGDEVTYLGQPVLAVAALDDHSARRAARRLSCGLEVEQCPAVLDPAQAHRDGQWVVTPMLMERDAGRDVAADVAASPRQLSGTFSSGPQEHVYLETNVALAVPMDDGGVRVRVATQDPTAVQKLVAACLGLPVHRVRVECRRLGGGFGGKESQPSRVACIAAVAAMRWRRPARLRLDRVTDNLVTGKRHAFHSDFAIGYDDDGRIRAADVTLVAQGGHSADLSAPVLTRAMCNVDSAYWLPRVRIRGYAARTNTQSSTAFRGFGGPQGALVMEQAIEAIARDVGRDPLDVRLLNLYGEGGDTTPYGEVVERNILRPLIEDLVVSSDYRARRAAIEDANRASPLLMRGLALTPVKFGISFHVTHFNQAGALVHVYVDGSVVVNHSATEMGQGVNTKVRQVVAQELGIPLALVRCTATDTEKIANTSATAASTGSDMNGQAALAAAQRIRDRLVPVAARLLGAEESDVRFADGRAWAAGTSVPFGEVTTAAYRERVQLWSDGFYATPGVSWDGATMQGRPFHYFCFGAAVSEVVVDPLTGESRVLRADLLMDVGRSLNPGVDIGQVEGAFVQGMGWLTQEEVRWDPSTGRLLTLAPTTYKPPTAHDVPVDLRTRLYGQPAEPDTIHGSKAVGEPPLLLASSVFLAIADAIGALVDHRVHPPLMAPATPEAILAAIAAVRQGA